MTPSLWLALLIVLIGAQVGRVTAPRRVPYVVLLLLSAAGFVVAELGVNALHTGGPALGVLHPIADAIGIGLCEGVAITFTAQRRRAP